MGKKVFIMNVSENDDIAIQIHSFLEKNGIKCFQYRIDLLGGRQIEQKTEYEIENSDHCIICFSKEFNERKKTDMRREILTAIKDSYQRKLDSNFLIPIKVNQCEIEDFKINSTTSMKDISYIDFSKNSESAYNKLLKSILDSGLIDSINTTEFSETPQLISLQRDKQPMLKFYGFFLGECANLLRWKYKVYKTVDTVKECDYIIHVDRTNSKVHLDQLPLYDVIQYDSNDLIETDLFQKIEDEECRMEILELLGIVESEYLE